MRGKWNLCNIILFLWLGNFAFQTQDVDINWLQKSQIPEAVGTNHHKIISAVMQNDEE